MSPVKKKRTTKPKPKPKYISENYCPRVIVFKRINEVYKEHPRAKAGQHMVCTGFDDSCGLMTDLVGDANSGWLFERTNIDDPESEGE